MKPLEKKKLKLYGLFWGAVLIVPTLPLLWGALGITGHFSSFEEILSLWLSILPILVLFLIHNFLVLPLGKKSKPLYIAAGFVLIALFGIYCFTLGDHPPGLPAHINPMELTSPSHQPARPAALMLGFGVLAILANYGADAIVENERKERERKLLEINNLRLQLDALRYQINPHFFLNTLNNIQALILVDPEKASESIGVFSKMTRMVMRYGDALVIPLADEVGFIESLISLTRLRYTDNVSIETSLAARSGDAVIQPLVLATFVENAFKHGISYERPSFVKVNVEHRDGRIIFQCENTLHTDSHAESYGIGLENVRKRLSLMYEDKYHLTAEPSRDHYKVELILPDKIDMPAL